MKLIRSTDNELILKENTIMTRLLGIFFVLISSSALYVVLNDYQDSYKPVVIMCGVFFLIGCFILFLLTARLKYTIIKSQDQFQIEYPVRFGTNIEIKTFKLSELRSIQLKNAIGASTSHSGMRGPQHMQGFDFELTSGELIHGGIYSTSVKEISHITNNIISFKKVPIYDSDKREIIW